mmetsp:Transcript_12820/g.27049  ORF Transcript_12820/g.27049 Transcript_12820/m.27049 type:complete len:247 (+) Transcript_12820:147-887(+)
MGIHWPEPTATPPIYPLMQLRSKCLRPMGTRLPEPTSITPSPPLLQLRSKSVHPMGTRWPEPTATSPSSTPNHHLMQLPHMSIRPMGNRLSGPTAKFPNAHLLQLTRMCLRPMGMVGFVSEPTAESPDARPLQLHCMSVCSMGIRCREPTKRKLDRGSLRVARLTCFPSFLPTLCFFLCSFAKPLSWSLKCTSAHVDPSNPSARSVCQRYPSFQIWSGDRPFLGLPHRVGTTRCWSRQPYRPRLSS